MGPFSYASLSNLALIEDLYSQYLKNPESVDLSWRNFFEGMDFAARMPRREAAALISGSDDMRIYHLIQAYRIYGHKAAHFNPLVFESPKEPPELSLTALGFSQEELSKSFPTCGFLKENSAPLEKLIEALKETYCNRIGIEYMGCGNPDIERWIQQRIEPRFPIKLSSEEKLHFLACLNKAEIFESFLHTKYVGQKRFSLEGSETLIPLLMAIIEEGAKTELTDVVLGMAHRGRLNVLSHILNKSYALIFHEFEDSYSPELGEGSGDVKYHKGYVGTMETPSGKVMTVTLSANPSHLEAVDPVVIGGARAKQELKGDRLQKKEVLPLLIHGDSAVAGQGVVYEVMQMSRLTGYSTGGTIHVVVNNQIGFTTTPKDYKSTPYCTDIARTFGAPIFHVNCEDPEACVAAGRLAFELRQQFQCDVFIDLVGYRKYGHNEGDEPTFTQPQMYKEIRSKKPIRTLYRDQLIKEGVIDQPEADKMEEEFRKGLQQVLDTVKTTPSEGNKKIELIKDEGTLPTGVPSRELIALAEKFCSVPAGFHPHPKIEKLLRDRLEMVHADSSKPLIDWGMGEHLAFASLVNEGKHVRISGQDSRRGTFSHRHAYLVDMETQTHYYPLSHLNEKQGLFDVFNSQLSEASVLGFEFGYNLFFPDSLIVWEAQYGDFANGAQVYIDQFLSSAEQKWGLNSSLVLFLPHGYEGQGPEHSSGRMERFLQLCARDNMRVVNCTTPAQFFHLLRRQVHFPVKKPLIVFTPKALLRLPLCLSSLNEFSGGSFMEILDDPTPPKNPKRLIFCSGRIFYDLLQEREELNRSDIAIIRFEQIYPFHSDNLKPILDKYAGFQECFWVQEEPSNMGAGEFFHLQIEPQLKLDMKVRYICRGRNGSPAAGSHALHKKEQKAILKEAIS